MLLQDGAGKLLLLLLLLLLLPLYRTTTCCAAAAASCCCNAMPLPLLHVWLLPLVHAATEWLCRFGLLGNARGTKYRRAAMTYMIASKAWLYTTRSLWAEPQSKIPFDKQSSFCMPLWFWCWTAAGLHRDTRGRCYVCQKAGKHYPSHCNMVT